jgi:hypothetical protein
MFIIVLQARTVVLMGSAVYRAGEVKATLTHCYLANIVMPETAKRLSGMTWADAQIQYFLYSVS